MIKYILAIMFCTVSAFSQWNYTYQSYIQTRQDTVSVDFYLADSTFQVDFPLNDTAYWYQQSVRVPVTNGILNWTIAGIPTNAIVGNRGNIYLWVKVDGTSFDRVALGDVPYSTWAQYSDSSNRSNIAVYADSANLSGQSIYSIWADSARWSYSVRDNSISTNSLQNASVVSSKIVDGAVTSTKIADAAVHTSHIEDGAVTNSKLANASVTADKIALNSVYTQHIVNETIINDDLSGSSVDSRVIQDGSVSSSDLGMYSVISSTIAPMAVSTFHIADGNVTADDISGGTGAQEGQVLTKTGSGLSWTHGGSIAASSCAVYSIAPVAINNDTRFVVSKVAMNYQIVAPTAADGRMITLYNAATANTVTVSASTWQLANGSNIVLTPQQSVTLVHFAGNWYRIANP